MTREENLHWLNQEIRTWENECQSKHPIKEALYAARKALEQDQDKPMVEINLYSVIKQKYIEREVLDKIRAEIEQLRLHKAQLLTNDNKVCIDSQEVLNILDKYKSESEVNNGTDSN